MAPRYKLAILPSAQSDVEIIYLWLRERSQLGAASWFQAFELMLDRLADAPLEFPAAPESEPLQRSLRQALFKSPRGRTYRAVFLIEEDAVYVLRVRGPGQPPLTSDELEMTG